MITNKVCQLINGVEAISLLGGSRAKLRRLVADGILRSYKYGPNILFLHSDVEKLKRELERQSADA